jgi:AcrR family transcriptional regulator
MADGSDGRTRQRQRTRRDLLEAAGRLARESRAPTLEQVAAEAMVSRATAYRYFPNVEALWTEAALHLATPQADALFAADPGTDATRRLTMVDEALETMIEENEPALRAMLAQSLERSLAAETPLNRQNRRSPLIDAALEPVKDEFEPAALVRMKRALAILLGTEAAIVTKDVLQLTRAEARATRRWALSALIAAARKPG